MLSAGGAARLKSFVRAQLEIHVYPLFEMHRPLSSPLGRADGLHSSLPALGNLSWVTGLFLVPLQLGNSWNIPDTIRCVFLTKVACLFQSGGATVLRRAGQCKL